MQITVAPMPEVFAGNDAIACVNQNYQLIEATQANTAALSWSHNGDGTLNANNILNPPVYTPAASDAGNVIVFTLSATGLGQCATETTNSVMQLTITPLPTAFAGTDRVTCALQPIQITDATATNYGSLLWTHNGNGSLNATNILNPIYTPLASDGGHMVILTLTVTGQGGNVQLKPLFQL